MNRLAFALAVPLAFLPSLAYAQTEASLNGKWKMHTNVSGNESDSDCTFTQNEKNITGSCKGGDQAEVKITGQIDGSKATLNGNSDYNGTPLTMKYAGELASGKITGSVDVDPFGVSGDFTLTKATEAK